MSTIAFLVACHFVLNLYYVITVYSVYGEINMMMMMMMMMMAAVVLMSFFVLYSVFLLYVNPIIATLEAQSSGPLYNNTVIGTLAVGGWAVQARQELARAPGQTTFQVPLHTLPFPLPSLFPLPSHPQPHRETAPSKAGVRGFSHGKFFET